MSIEDYITMDDWVRYIEKKHGVCSLCGANALETSLMIFINKNDEEIRFCEKHSPWHRISEAQRNWHERMMKHPVATRIAMQEAGDTEPDNPLPSWCKDAGEGSR